MLDFIEVAGGVFDMGSTMAEVERCVADWSSRLVDPGYDAAEFRRWILKEYPNRTVAVAPFRITRFPITNEEYGRFAADTGRGLPESIERGESADHPVWGVSYDDAGAFAEWATARCGFRCAVPTEEQWEYAARGPSRRQYPFGDEFDAAACNTLESGIGRTTPVDRYPNGASPFGILDMAGNVEEWTSSRYEPYPGGAFVEDHLSLALGPRYRILRGGSFARGGDLARCARRHGPLPRREFRFTGFRLAASAS